MTKVYLQEKLTAGDNINITDNTISADVPEISEATQSAAGLMPASDKKKLDGITLSNDLTETGANVVPANIIYKAIDKKQDKLTFDTSPTSGSNNPVTSGGVYTMKNNLDTAIGKKQDMLTFDSTPTSDSTNPVTSGGVRSAIDAIPVGISKHLITSVACKGDINFNLNLESDVMAQSLALTFEFEKTKTVDLGYWDDSNKYIRISNSSYPVTLLNAGYKSKAVTGLVLYVPLSEKIGGRDGVAASVTDNQRDNTDKSDPGCGYIATGTNKVFSSSAVSYTGTLNVYALY